MNPIVLGTFILDGPIALASAVFWTGVFFWIRDIHARQVMDLFRPKAKHVHHTEKILRVTHD